MLFYAPEFIFIFLPATLVGFYLLGRYQERLAFLWLAAASLFFYSYWSTTYLPLICASVAVNHVHVVAGFPAFIERPEHRSPQVIAFLDQIERFYQTIGLPVLGKPTDYFFSKALFFDTGYHMTADGAALMTLRLGDALALHTPLGQHSATLGSAENGIMTVDFSADGYPGFLDEVDGLANKEVWGRWTEGAEAKFKFFEPLPRKFLLEIVAHSAFGKNAKEPFLIRVGLTEKHATFAKPGDVIRIPIELHSDERVLELIPASPTSPKDLGLSQDPRRLGIGLAHITVRPRQN